MSSINVSNLLAAKFIARKDVKAIQFPNGSWTPHEDLVFSTGTRSRIPWRREDIEAHLEGKSTFGHYLLDADSRCKLFAFDVDLKKVGRLPAGPYFAESEPDFEDVSDLRAAWLNRAHPARDYMKYQFKSIAHKLLRAISEELWIPCAAAYSGAKGIHVYGFTGLIAASEAREGAQIVLDTIGGFSPTRGENFFEHTDFPNFSIELFPKQSSLEGKDLGNLMRLPLGKNRKALAEPTFFLDMSAPPAVLRPVDPELALTMESPWGSQ